ncbi:MAG TPA: Dyp-type peroxidase [Actinomycetota bacterium]|jgi:deferrochelatase/peroxidase EfeB
MPLPRRRFLGYLGAAGVGAAAGATGVRLATDAASSDDPSAGAIAFHGSHQAGIATPRQHHALFATVDVADAVTEVELLALLRFWTEAAARMTTGTLAADPSDDPLDVPWDTGEAVDLGPNRLTLTFGVGPALFDPAGDRFGWAAHRPDDLRELPAFETDHLDPAGSGGDLCIQACADDEQVAFHAVRELLRLGNGIVTLRWSQAGFLPRVPEGASPRNLLGFRDGTRNIRGDDAAALDRFVWVGTEGPAWLRGGTYLVARRIDIRTDEWDASSLALQESVIGRSKQTGAPRTGRTEHDPPDLQAVDGDGVPMIAPNAHVRLSAPGSNGGTRILRRSYSFADPTTGGLGAGLLFLSYQRHPNQFVTIQRRLAGMDALNRYTRHTGSALFAMFPGVESGGALGRDLAG